MGDEKIRERETFQSPYDQYKELVGKPFRIVDVITKPDNDHDAEVLPMYIIDFEDGIIIEAWPEEVFEIEQGGP